MSNLLTSGLIALPWWGYLLVTLGFTHLTSVGVTLYLHRCQAHRSVAMHPLVSHFFRLWLWLTTGQVTREWVAVHRKHHAKCETEQDPHSPVFYGIQRVLWGGAFLYRRETHNPETLAKYGHATPHDWLERHLYTARSTWGPVSMLALDLLLFGLPGLAMWAVQMVWTPFWAAGVINGIGHYWGYRNFECKDAATNIVPIGVIAGGEELHNNHHAFPSSARFSQRRGEFDLGWAYLRLLERVRLVTIRKVAPRPHRDRQASGVDRETLQAIVVQRMHVLRDYARRVTVPTLKGHADGLPGISALRARQLLVRDQSQLSQRASGDLERLLAAHPQLHTVYHFRERLQEIWESNGHSDEHLLERIREWCRHAEASGVEALRGFAARLQTYRPVPASIATR